MCIILFVFLQVLVSHFGYIIVQLCLFLAYWFRIHMCFLYNIIKEREREERGKLFVVFVFRCELCVFCDFLLFGLFQYICFGCYW